MGKGKDEKKDNEKFETGWSKAGKAIIILAVICPFFIMLISKTGFSVLQINNLGQVGDFFGGTTVGLLSLASIFFIIHSIAIQGEELKLTREEFKTGNSTAKVQQIDNAFFNMLSLHHQIVNNITITESDNTYTGRKAIEKLRNALPREFASKLFLKQHPEQGVKGWLNGKTQKAFIDKLFDDDIRQEDLDEFYKYFHDKHGNNIGHYMRFNYRIVKFIVNNVVNDENEQKKILEETGRDTIIGDRRYYFGMLRAQWSNAEFELILINSLYSENRKFKELILKYDVLDIEDTENKSDVFKLKDSMNKFKAYRKLIEVKK